MSYTAVHIPEFPVVARQREQPEVRSSACAVADGIAPQEKVVSLCEKARASGIVHGMSKVQTETSGLVGFRSREIAQEQVAFACVLEVAERFSPRVEAIASPTDAYAGDLTMSVRLLIDSSGTGTLFGSAESYARKLHRELRKTASLPVWVRYRMLKRR